MGNDRNTSRMFNRWVKIEMQNMQVNTREKRSLVLNHSVRSSKKRPHRTVHEGWTERFNVEESGIIEVEGAHERCRNRVNQYGD